MYEAIVSAISNIQVDLKRQPSTVWSARAFKSRSDSIFAQFGYLSETHTHTALYIYTCVHVYPLYLKYVSVSHLLRDCQSLMRLLTKCHFYCFFSKYFIFFLVLYKLLTHVWMYVYKICLYVYMYVCIQ